MAGPFPWAPSRGWTMQGTFLGTALILGKHLAVVSQEAFAEPEGDDRGDQRVTGICGDCCLSTAPSEQPAGGLLHSHSRWCRGLSRELVQSPTRMGSWEEWPRLCPSPGPDSAPGVADAQVWTNSGSPRGPATCTLCAW